MTVVTGDPIVLRVQRLDLQTQTLVLATLAADRNDDRIVTQSAVSRLYDAFSLPAPAKISNTFASLKAKALLVAVAGRGAYKVTPLGRAKVAEQLSGLDLVALVAEGASQNAPYLGGTELSLIPYTLAPPELIRPLKGFLEDHSFDTNVFGMTRFPDAKAGTKDPVGRALAVATEVCSEHGLKFHLASDRSIVDDLWSNVTAHMWGCRYGIGFFEDRLDRGINHNLLIEVGAMVMTGRRCALLKDGSIDKLPTDFIGMIYKSVDLSDESSVRKSLQNWINQDLRIGKL